MESVETGCTYSGRKLTPTCVADRHDRPTIDLAAVEHWIYPQNIPVRQYQFDIVHTSLFHNTMVCLPTGLGKTLIAAVVMYNFYKWFPTGKLVFMAPTRPLVEQQISACTDIMGFPPEDSVELTGHIPAATRAKYWQEKRLFYVTPQVRESSV